MAQKAEIEKAESRNETWQNIYNKINAEKLPGEVATHFTGQGN
jgi:hypothetical protein